MKKFLLIAVIVGVVGFVLIQFIPYGHDHTNPPVVNEPNWPDTQTRNLVAGACYDCHSNETNYPWYSYVAPVSWLTEHDKQDGREHLNFSEWTNSQHDVNEIAEVVSSGEMPMPIYAVMHKSAQLTDVQRQMLIDGIKATLNTP